jgi:hypothetical protein
MKARAPALVLHLLVILAGVVAAFHPTLFSGFRQMQTDPGDTLLNAYILEHSWQCLSRPDYVGSIWSPPCFHPARDVLAYSENLFGSAPLYWAFRLLTPDLLAFQLWMIGVTALTYIVFVAALRWMNVRHLLCAAGGFVFTFGMARVNQINHQQLLPQMFAPLAVVAIWRFLREPNSRLLAGFVFAFVLQVSCSIYLGWFLALGLAIFVAILLAADRSSLGRIRDYLRATWRTAGAIVLAGGAMLFAILRPYVRANRDFHRYYADCVLPELRSWIAAPPDSVCGVVLSNYREGLPREHWLFVGFALLFAFGIAAVFAMVKLRGAEAGNRLLVAAAVITTLILVAVTVRWPGGASAWRYVFKLVPGAAGLRAVTRVFTVVYLFGIIASMVALDRMIGRVSPSWQMTLCVVFLAFTAVEQLRWRLPSFDHAAVFQRVAAVSAGLKGQESGYVALDDVHPFWENQLVAMWGGLKANVPVVNGYTGRWPGSYPSWSRNLSDDELQGWLRDRGPTRLAVLRSDGTLRTVLMVPPENSP